MESFDLRHAIIPFSLLQISNHYQKMKPGEVIEVVGSDMDVTDMIKKVLPTSDCEIIGDENQTDDDRKIVIRIRKKIA